MIHGSIKKKSFSRDFPGGPMIKTLSFHFREQRVQSLVRKLGSCMSCGVAKK